MHTRSLWALVFALLFLLPASTVEGQKVQPSERGPWELTLFAGGFDDDFEFDPDGSIYYVDPDGNVLFGAGLNYHLPYHLGPFGTFVGLTAAILGVEGVIDTLSNFQDLTRLQTEMKVTLGGMRTAFSTSLAGLAAAMILGIVLLEFSSLQAKFVARLEEETTRHLIPFFEAWSHAVSGARRPAPPIARPSTRAAPRAAADAQPIAEPEPKA